MTPGAAPTPDDPQATVDRPASPPDDNHPLFDRESFGRVYQETFPTVFRYACVLTGEASLAEDVAADVYLRAWRARDRFRGEGPVLSWLLAMTHNAAMTAHRRRARAMTANENLARPEATEGPESAHRSDRDTEGMESALRRLSPDQQAVVLLRFVDGRSHGEVAALLGRQAEAVRALQYRALKNLRKELGPAEEG